MNAAPSRAALVAALQPGLPLVPRPYAEIAATIGTAEQAVLDATRELEQDGSIARLGLVVRHRKLGFVHNAMVVWDVPDERVDQVGKAMTRHDFVTLCYRRPRRLPLWPYNLFCMVHGRQRVMVRAQVDVLAAIEGLEGVRHEALFSSRCFKQRGARYVLDASRQKATPRASERHTADAGACS